ncbi:MAG: L-ribulose-5-phosphate 4-epimerase [Candidatus Bipolaricaulia bacterium]
MLETLKREVHDALLELPKNNLVSLSSGNVSGRQGEYVVIKPSGVPYDQLSPFDLVVVDLEGNVVEGALKPSVDTATHLYMYRHMEGIQGIVHTHSTYATTFALLGEPLPVYLTEMADMLGADVPVTDYAPVGDEAIGQEVVSKIDQSKAVLLRRHGVFTVGSSPTEALKVAVLVEHSAKIVHLAMLRGQPEPMPREDVEAAYRKYQNEYGQR